MYNVNQGQIPLGEAVDEQLAAMNIKPSDLDYVLLTHLDCDHANGLRAVKDAKHIIVAQEELDCARKNGFIRYKKKWWEGVDLETIEWNGTEGPAGKSFDLFGDGSVKMINIPGHCNGLCAVKITREDGKYVLLFSDGGYATKSWKEMITSVCRSTRRCSASRSNGFANSQWTATASKALPLTIQTSNRM